MSILFADLCNAKTIKNLLDGGANVNMRDASGNSLLHLVIPTNNAKYSCLDSFYLLLHAGIDVNVRNNENKTALDCAVRFAHKNIVEALLENGAEVDREDCDLSVLSVAAKAEDKQLFKLLLDLGANVHFQNKDGTSPLHLVPWLTDSSLISTVIQRAISINWCDASGYTLLHYAAREGNAILVQMLLEGGADVSVAVTQRCITNRTDTNNHNRIGETPLLSALERSDLKIIKLLSKYGAHFTARTKIGETALHYAARNPRRSVVKFLLDIGFKVDIRDGYNRTPLHSAVMICKSLRGSYGVLKVLLKNGANPNVRNLFDITPLLYALESRDLKIVKLLSDYGADFTVMDKKDETALHYAARNPHAEIISFLLRDKGFDVNIEDSSGRTPLHCAVMWENLQASYDVVKVLLENGANPNTRNQSGESPLLSALENSDLRTIKLLSDHRADFTAKGVDGRTVFHYAALNQCAEVISFIPVKVSGINILNDLGSTALHCVRNPDTCRSLLDRGANISCKNSNGKSALEMLVQEECQSEELIEVLVAHIAKLDCLNIVIDQDDIELIKRHHKLTEYYGICKSELQKMKSLKVYKNLSALDILFASKNKMSVFIRNKDLVTSIITLDSSLCKDLHVYFPSMLKKLEKTVWIQSKTKKVHPIISDIMNLRDPTHPVCEVITSFLDAEDVKYF